VINVSSFSSVVDGRPVYQKGRPLEWWVDSEEYSIIDMEKMFQNTLVGQIIKRQISGLQMKMVKQLALLLMKSCYPCCELQKL
jgi:hypothetical protein